MAARAVTTLATLTTLIMALGAGAGQGDPSIDAILTQLGRAASLFFEELPVESSGLACRFGNPAAGQRRRAQRVAREMLELTVAAELAAEQFRRDLESRRGPGDRELLNRLGDERNRRLPFLRGVAACLHADFNVEDPSARDPLYALAADRLTPLAEMLPGRLAVLARLYAGLARLGAGDEDRARVLLERAAADPEALPQDAFAARMGLMLIAAAVGGPRAALDELDEIASGHDDLFFRVLIADQRFRLLGGLAAEAAGDRRRALAADAYHAYLDLIDRDDADRVRDVVTARLVEVVDADAPFAILPGLVRVAWAEQLARRPDTRAQAIAVFDELVASGALEPGEHADALFGLARAHLADDLPAAAVRFLQVAGEHPSFQHAGRSIELAATISAELYRAAPGDPDRRTRLRETLTLLLDRYRDLATVDEWRYYAGCLALDEGRYESVVAAFEAIGPEAARRLDARFRIAETVKTEAAAGRRQRWPVVIEAVESAGHELREGRSGAGVDRGRDLDQMLISLTLFRAEALVALGEPDRALDLIETDTPPDLPESVLVRISAYEALGRDADVRQELRRLRETAGDRAGPMLGDLITARQTQLDRDDSGDATSEAARVLVPAAFLLDDWLGTADGEHAGLRLIAADAFRLGGRCDRAVPLYEQLRIDHGDTIEALVGRADCLFATGDDAEAMGLYARLGSGLGPEDETYWLAHLRMLQILDRTGRNRHRIAPHIQQLLRKDGELGGERFRREFERLLRKE